MKNLITPISLLFLCTLFVSGCGQRTPQNISQKGVSVCLGFLPPLSMEDHRTLVYQLDILLGALRDMNVAIEEGIESFDHIIDERVQEAIGLSKRIISGVDSPIILPSTFSHMSSYHSGCTCQECIVAYFEYVYAAEYESFSQFRSVVRILECIFTVHLVQSDIDSLLQTILLLEVLCSVVQLNNLGTCDKIFIGYHTIVRMSERAFERYPIETQLVLKEMLERVKLRLNRLVYGLIYGAKNETLLTYPLLLQQGNKEFLLEAMELVAYYHNVLENKPVFFDLAKGLIFNVESIGDLIDFEMEDNLINQLRFMKALVQINRDHYADIFQRISFIQSENP